MLRQVSFENYEDWVSPRIHDIAKVFGRTELHTEIKEACINKRAFLFVDENGFVVLKPFVRDGEIIVLVWAAWSPSGDAMSEHQETVEEYAKLLGAKELEFYTARKGYDRLAPRFGWEKSQTVWKKTL